VEFHVIEAWPIVDSIAWLLILSIIVWLWVRLGGDPADNPNADLPSSPLDDVGEPAKYAVRLALTFGNWVHRRIETFEFVDADTVRRKMSVDFTFPKDGWLTDGQIVYVPVMLLGKENLRNLDVVDPTGRSLNVLTLDESQAVTLQGLEHLLETKGRPGPTEILKRIAYTGLERGNGGTERTLNSDDEMELGLNEYSSATRGQIRALINDLGHGFMLFVSMEYRSNERRLVKLSYDTRINHRRFTELYRWLTRLVSSVGLLGRQEEFGELAVGWAKSYHAEVVPASDTYSAEATLEVERPKERLFRTRDDHPSRPHLKALGAGPGTSRGDTGRLTLILHARRDGLVFPLFASAAIITAVLAFVPQQAGHLDGLTLGALLLAPFALAAYYASSAENSYVTNTMRGVRLVATIPVAAGILVIALQALGYLDLPEPGHPGQMTSHENAVSAARVAAHVAAWATAGLLVALVSPRLGAWTRPAIWALQNRVERSHGSKRSRLVALLGAAGGTLALFMLGLATVVGLYKALPL
jgi:hypothetical protein